MELHSCHEETVRRQDAMTQVCWTLLVGFVDTHPSLRLSLMTQTQTCPLEILSQASGSISFFFFSLENNNSSTQSNARATQQRLWNLLKLRLIQFLDCIGVHYEAVSNTLHEPWTQAMRGQTLPEPLRPQLIVLRKTSIDWSCHVTECVCVVAEWWRGSKLSLSLCPLFEE